MTWWHGIGPRTGICRLEFDGVLFAIVDEAVVLYLPCNQYLTVKIQRELILFFFQFIFKLYLLKVLITGTTNHPRSTPKTLLLPTTWKSIKKYKEFHITFILCKRERKFMVQYLPVIPEVIKMETWWHTTTNGAAILIFRTSERYRQQWFLAGHNIFIAKYEFHMYMTWMINSNEWYIFLSVFRLNQ